MNFRSTIKPFIPQPAWKTIGREYRFGKRIALWPIISKQVRSLTARDQATLLKSAAWSPIEALEDLDVWQDPLLLDDIDVFVSGVGEFALRGRTDDLWHVLPWRERSIVREMQLSLSSGDVFIDAGANIGFYSILASRLVGPTGKVIAIEMMEDTAGRLRANLDRNASTNVVVHQVALGDRVGHAVATTTPGKSGQASISRARPGGLSRHSKVEVCTLDQLLAELDGIRMIKLDLEGSELTALKGATVTLGKTSRLTYERWADRADIQDILDSHLRTAGFSISAIDATNWIASRDGGIAKP